MTVHVRLMPTLHQMQIGILALSAPERINAQNLSMVRQMTQALLQWQAQDDVVAVVLIGAGERGFCAGGDLKALYEAMMQPEQIAQGDAFFAEEYALCQMIRDYKKPVLAWGHGIVMGGGWGLFAAASHRVVTESSKLAMPETAIGLFPDVAASRWLPELAGYGQFLALSGAAINAADALLTGAAQWALPDAKRHSVLAELAGLPWQGDVSDAALLDDFLSQQISPSLAAPHLTAHHDALQDRDGIEVSQRCVELRNFSQSADPWLAHAVERIYKASPTSLWLASTLQQRCKTLSFPATVQLETQVSAACLRYGDFSAGIYATLIDRSSKPRWQQTDLMQLDQMQLAEAFPMLF
ncbi:MULTISPECIES: enoyl-CoA hydratase/isomerase family protein [Deefgea]|uniref:3-hydroxyisobutyryl-CoA hydrolase n=1 Tax=Deefgea chitinilytica TaxID=570276 RepID=A0ABS2C7L8_9NEIS|nr:MULTISPECIES: enoyl-CoA hydratase/isomerase family protein [Deefgea]MBM5570153.1 enoyl-CoA hydratase/isomerase family protein [Deefgea chitinilytica]MBM9887382.1 enoyl-CoA hydratase/isomerase family protein [Deefgea sp. CFH1-16]